MMGVWIEVSGGGGLIKVELGERLGGMIGVRVGLGRGGEMEERGKGG